MKNVLWVPHWVPYSQAYNRRRPMCINIKVFDAIAALPGRGCSMREVVEALPDIDRESVISAVHRLSEKGVLRLHRVSGVGAFYAIASGATRPADGRGRPRKQPINAPA